MPPLAIAADDRTGALEVAGECADRGAGPVLVTVLGRDHRESVPRACTVVDLGSRHLELGEAAARAAQADVGGGGHRAHKIDSLLRGNWAAELVARHRASGRRILIVAALPAMGRICRGGIVRVDGVPLADLPLDARGGDAPPSSRPADHLTAAGVTDVVELRSAADLPGWHSAFAVVDAGSTDELAAIGAAWCALADEVVLAGTAAAIAAAVGMTEAPPAPPPVGTGEILVVCGSLHPRARAQLDRLAQERMEAVTVVASPEPAARPVIETEALAAASRLAGYTRRLIDSTRPAAVVVIGGDTAAALLGDGPRIVGGTVVPGAPWSRPLDGRGPLVVTRAGSFGVGDALVELIARLRGGGSR